MKMAPLLFPGTDIESVVVVVMTWVMMKVVLWWWVIPLEQLLDYYLRTGM